MGRTKTPISVAVGEPIPPDGTVPELLDEVRERMAALLDEVQRDYPQPAGAFWVPHRLGGAAPTPAQAKVLDEAELVHRARRVRR
ncbi:hypothetical protein MKOR_32790 [Mycolicibacillus koreensis]|nr:hypothetical protein MKOR_32790 [Mycolicibacillus koreensis]